MANTNSPGCPLDRAMPPATFQCIMNEVFHDLIGKGLYVYIDDIVIYSASFEEHMHLLHKVLCCLRTHCLYLKPKKCTIATEQVDLLGHVVDKNGVRPSPTKIRSIAEYPQPTNKAELHAFPD